MPYLLKSCTSTCKLPCTSGLGQMHVEVLCQCTRTHHAPALVMDVSLCLLQGT